MTARAGGHRDPRTTQESVEVRHDGRVVAAADVTADPDPHGTASVTLRARRDEATPEARSELVDQVLDHPDVASSDTVHVVVPLGDGASIARLRERTANVDARAAGASSIIEAEVVRPSVDDDPPAATRSD